MPWSFWCFRPPFEYLLLLLMVPQVTAAAEVNPSASAQATDSNASSKVSYEDAAVIVHWQYVLVGVAGCFVLLLGTIIICLQLRRLRIEMGRQETDAEMFGYRQYHVHRPHLATVTVSTLDLVSPVFVYRQNEKPSSNTPRATEDGTNNLATWFADASEQTCTICLEDFVDQTSSVRRLRCGHLYHAPCIDQWLTARSCLCPVCKAPCFRNTQGKSNQDELSASDQEATATAVIEPHSPMLSPSNPVKQEMGILSLTPDPISSTEHYPSTDPGPSTSASRSTPTRTNDS